MQSVGTWVGTGTDSPKTSVIHVIRTLSSNGYEATKGPRATVRVAKQLTAVATR